MKNTKNYEVGSTQTLDQIGEGKVLKKRCYQCRKTSVVKVPRKDDKGPWQACLNNCGPEHLAKMLRF